MGYPSYHACLHGRVSFPCCHLKMDGAISELFGLKIILKHILNKVMLLFQDVPKLTDKSSGESILAIKISKQFEVSSPNMTLS